MSQQECPYRPCLAIIDTMESPPFPGVDRPMRDMIPIHDIEHPILRGRCPGSLMYVPLDAASEAHLRAMEGPDGTRITTEIQRESERTWDEVFPEDTPDSESQSLRGPHRIGREPVIPDDENSWQLGGREDEDSGKQASAIKPPKLPATVAGQEIGRHVASIDEMIGQVQQAALSGGEAIASLRGAEDMLGAAMTQIEAARATLVQLQGQANSQVILDYIAQLNVAYEGILQMHSILPDRVQEIEMAQNYGESFIGRLLG